MNVADFERWRESIPWTQDQIVAALREAAETQPNEYMRERKRQLAAWVAGGKLSGFALREARPFLIKKCHFCGKKALYCSGNFGGCSTHRYLIAKLAARWTVVIDAPKSAREERIKEVEQVQQRRSSRRANAGNRKHKDRRQ